MERLIIVPWSNSKCNLFYSRIVYTHRVTGYRPLCLEFQSFVRLLLHVFNMSTTVLLELWPVL